MIIVNRNNDDKKIQQGIGFWSGLFRNVCFALIHLKSLIAFDLNILLTMSL